LYATEVGGIGRFHPDDFPKTPISRQFVFSSAEKVHEAALRGNGLIDMESRHDLDEAINIGRGGIWLALSEDQYSGLVTSKLQILEKTGEWALNKR
jgi:hypothetical protein